MFTHVLTAWVFVHQQLGPVKKVLRAASRRHWGGQVWGVPTQCRRRRHDDAVRWMQDGHVLLKDMSNQGGPWVLATHAHTYQPAGQLSLN
jgi:hypothetical protein